MKYNVIGDIHGRTCWKDLVIPDGVNIFVGDYFSPYERIDYEVQKSNFLDIIQFKLEHPETVLLVGNHDEDHWHWRRSGCGRHDYEHEDDIRQLFEENKDLFCAAYCVGNKYLITHAGLSATWYVKNVLKPKYVTRGWGYPFEFDTYTYRNATTVEEAIEIYTSNIKRRYAETPGDSPETKQYKADYVKKVCEVQPYSMCVFRGKWWILEDTWKPLELDPVDAAEVINRVWKESPSAFSFDENASLNDCYGTTHFHSPMWIRVGTFVDESLSFSNIYKGTEFVQIFGHTRSQDIMYYSDLGNADTGKMIMVDCLGFKAESYQFEV